jgi:hypothetical protein
MTSSPRWADCLDPKEGRSGNDERCVPKKSEGC